MKPRVFVSSVMEGFELFRAAARSGITSGGSSPVLIEDYPSIPTSPRNACLDVVDSCDAQALVIGSRGGWVAPSGKLVVEEELEEAVRKGLSIFVFIQETERDQRVRVNEKVLRYLDA